MIKVNRRRRVFSLLSWRAIMAHLSLWFTLLLLATAQRDRNWRRDRNGRRHWRGMGAGASDTNTRSPVSPNVGSDGPRGVSTCRDAVTSGNYSRVFTLITDDAVRLDPFAKPLHLNGLSSKTLAVRHDVCPGNVSSCSKGLTIAMWLHPGDTSVPHGEMYYYLSNGAQRLESCGFYFRLDSVISSPEDGSLIGVFDVGIANSDTFWQIRYRATMMQKTHVLISWSPDLGMDVYVDGICAGTVLAHEGFQRSPVASCIDDPFTDMYIGGRNDLVSGGHPTADIGQLIMWDAWMNPNDVYNSTDEGVLRAYYENCLLRESISSSLQLLMNRTSIPDDYFASHCRSACLASGYKYVAIGGDGPSCYCVANYTYSKSHPIGSCNVCSGYTEITCGHMNSMSVYHTTSFLDGSLDQTSIQGLSASVDGVPTGYGNYTVVTHTNVNVSFSVTAGENVLYSIRGDARLKEIHMFESSTYLYFPEEGLYHLIVLATNELSRLEIELWITAEDDPARSGKLVVAMSSDGLAAVSNPVLIWADIANQGPNTTCTFDFGDGTELTFLQVESSLNLIHQYTNAGVFLVTAQCAEAENIPTNASITVIIQEPVTIILNTTFRVLKGANITIPFQITGTNVTGVEILYDGEAFAGNYTCSASFICEGSLEEAQTNTSGTHVFEVRASNLISVLESSRADVYVGVPIRNLTYKINATAIATNEGVELTAHITDGTLVYFHFTFDGNSTVFQCPKAPCQISHMESFAEAGDYEVFVEVSNDFNALKSEIYLVKVYNPVPDLSIDVVNSSSTQEPVQLIIYPTSNTSKWPTEATAVISIEGFANPIENSFTPSSPVHLTITYFLSIPLYGIFEASVNVSNAISTVVINVPIQIGHGITGFYAELSSEMHATGGNVSLQIGYAGGSEVVFSVDFGDGTRESLLLKMEVGNLSNQSEGVIAKETIYHQYSNPGDYVINVQAQNAFGDQVRTLSVSIFNQIEGLGMETNGINQATGTPISFVFFLEQGAAIPQTMTCSVDYGDSSDMDFWTGSLSHDIGVITEHTYRKPETLQVHANCSNEVSHVVLSVTVTLQVPVHECSINTVSQVATNTNVLYHALVSTGSDLTLSINYEDGSTGFLYIDGELDQNQSQIFDHVYNQAGLYTAQLSVSNAVSSCVAYSDTVLVQVPILNDSYSFHLVPKAVDVLNQPTIFEISLTDNTSIPTNVTAYWSFGDGHTSNTTLLLETSWTTSHIYKNTGVYNVRAYLFNKIGELTFNDTLAVLEKIGEIDYNIRPITPVGTNLTLTVQASSGSSIKYSVDFGDGTFDTRFEQEPELLEFVHSYDQAGNYDVTIHAENALSETVINDIMIMVVNPVEGLNFEASDDVLYNPGNVTFSLGIDGDVPSPTAMQCTWKVNNGSGVTTLKIEKNVTVIPGSNVSVIHEFPGGQFEVSLECENILGGVTFTKNVTVYEEIQGLKITSKDPVAEVGSQVHFTVTAARGSLVDYVIQFGDGQTDSRRVVSSFNTKLQDFYHLYSNPGVFVPSVTATNVLGQRIDFLNKGIKVLHSTRGFQLSSNSPLTFPKTLVTFTLDSIQGLSPPSTVEVVWYFGDTTSKGETTDVNRTHGIIENHVYNKSGRYPVTVTLTNHLDSHTFATIVIINGEIEPVRVGFEYKTQDGILQSGFGPESNWFPVGSEIKVNVNSTLTDASILWDLGSGETSSQDTIYQRYETPGVYNISLQVRSDSGEYTERHSYIYYVVDQLSLTSIKIDDAEGTSVLKSDSQVEFSLIGNGLDGPSCITWDAGDKSPQTTYGPVPCQLVSQNTFIKQRQRDGLLFTHVYTLPGSYVVNVSVTNFFSTAYEWRQITIVGCRGPPRVSIKGPGSTADTPRSHRSSEAILLDSTISLDCFGISSTSFDWDIHRLITNETQITTNKLPYDLHSSSGPQLYLSPGSLTFGLYEIRLTVTVNGFENATDRDRVYVQIEHSPLVLVIEGGSKRAVGNAHPLVLDAKTSSYDPDNTAGNTSDWSFTWLCQKSSNEGKHSNESDSASYLCDSSAWELLNFATAMIKLDPARLHVGGVYTFKVEASVNSRFAAQQQTVEVAQGEVPLVSIRCVSNCRDKTNPTSSFTLQGSCDNCDALGVSVFTWSLFVKDQSTEKYEVVDALGNMTSTGISKQGLAFNPNQLESGREYQLQLNVMDQLLGTGFTQNSFVTNLPPYNGSCHVTPTTGYVINTEFTVYCTGWLDEGYATDRSSISPDLAASQVLQYRVKSRPRGQVKYSLKTSSTDSLVSGVIFELGPEQFDYILELQIGVVDVFGATAYTDLTITVKRPDLSSDDLTSLVSSNGSSLSQLVSSGNVERATQLISAVLSLLPSEEDTNSSWSAEEVTELRSQLVLELSKMSVWAKTLDSLLQASGTMAKSVTGDVNGKALLAAAASMTEMAMTLDGLHDETPESVIDTAHGLTGGLGSLISQSDSLVENAMGTSQAAVVTTTPSSTGTSETVVNDYYGDDLSPEEIAEQAAIAEEERQRNEQNARDAALTISMLAQETLDLVSEVVVAQRVSGQPPVTLVTDQLTLEVFKDEPNSVAGRTIATGTGSFQLPNATVLFGGAAEKQVEQTLYSFNANPYSFSRSSANIGSSVVLTLEFTTGQGMPISVHNLTESISIMLEADQSRLESAEKVRMTFQNDSSWAYHKVELTDDNIELRVIFTETSNNASTFHVYLRKGSRPDTNTFDAYLEIPRDLGAQEHWDEVELETEARHTAVFPHDKLAGAGDYYLGVGLAGPASSGSVSNQTHTSDSVNVTLIIYAAGCRYWDTDIIAWSSEGCQVGPLTTSHSTHCLCNHLSSFAASFFVPPNTIDFSTVFSKFKDLGDNAGVFSTVVGFFGLYVILLVWLRRKDKQDIVKWGVSPLADNHPSDNYFYQITVQTGMGPGCGTRSKVTMIITGEDGGSDARLLDDDKRKVFKSGSICHFLMGVAGPLGPLSYIKLWHDNSGHGQHASWYLSQVSITDLQSGQQFFFVCDRWLAVEKDDGSVERVLPVATRSDLTQFSKLFYSSSRRNLFDDHIWFSLFSRPTRSSFTRVQRLSCCLCLLYLSMIASAMFYRAEEAVENLQALHLGPFIFTLQQVYIGIISAVIVIPVNLVIVQVFRKSKPSKSQLANQLPEHLQATLDHLKDGSSETSTPSSSVLDVKSDKTELVPDDSPSRSKSKNKKSKSKSFLLPHWCIYIAWLLMILSSLAAAFFTVLYSLEWGQQKSSEWLTSMLISLFNSVLVIQPVKVVVIAMIVAIIFKKPSKMDIEIDTEFSSEQNQLKRDEELLHQPYTSGQVYSNSRFYPPPSKAELEEARKMRLKEQRMNEILRETTIYTIFVTVVLFLCYSARDSMSFYMTRSLKDVFVENNGAENISAKLTLSSLEKSTPDLFWRWVETALIPGLYGSNYYNGEPMHWRHTRFIGDWEGYRVGPVRLRQLRVKNGSCQLIPDMSSIQPTCHLEYSWTNQDETNYSIAWQPKTTHNSRLYTDQENSPWIYQDFLKLNGVPYSGILALYSGGGYVAEFGTTTARALSTTQFLRQNNWYDALTRAIFVEFSVYNANANLFSVTTLLAETSTVGGALVSSTIHTLRLYHYDGPIAVFTIIFQVIFVAYLVYFFIKLILAVKKGGLKELKNFWIAVELTMLLLAIATIVMFAFRQIFIQLALKEVKNKDQGEFVNFSHIAKWDELFGYLLAAMAFLAIIRYMRLLRLNARMSLLGMTLGHASKDIIHFLLVWNIIFLAFGQLTYKIFHTAVAGFSSFLWTLETLFSMLLGKFDFNAMVEANRVLGGIIFVVYIMTMYMILSNMFITIVVEAFSHMRQDQGLDDAVDPEMVEYMVEKFKAFFLWPLQGGNKNNLQPKDEMTTYEDPMELLEQRVDKISRLVEASYRQLEASNGSPTGGSPVRSLSRISLHSARSATGMKGSPKPQRSRTILIA